MAGIVATALPASAQATTIDPNDFIDPVTGKFDVDAYLAALAALANRGDTGSSGSGVLPYTGSTTGDLIAGGVAVVVAGGAAVAISRRRRTTTIGATVDSAG